MNVVWDVACMYWWLRLGVGLTLSCSILYYAATFSARTTITNYPSSPQISGDVNLENKRKNATLASVRCKLDLLAAYRHRALCSATYDVSRVESIPVLPVLNGSNRHAYSEWYDYIEIIYKRPLALGERLDLNTFTWFYWFAPLRVSTFFMADWDSQGPEAPPNTPWIGGKGGWTFGPEHLVRCLGFFVTRKHSKRQSKVQAELSRHWKGKNGKFEVMRTGPNAFINKYEQFKAWFYPAVGSGIYLQNSENWSLKARAFLRGQIFRVELVLLHGKRGFWPRSMSFQLGNGDVCNLTSQYTRLLSCNNLALPLWPDTRTRLSYKAFCSIATCHVGRNCGTPLMMIGESFSEELAQKYLRVLSSYQESTGKPPAGCENREPDEGNRDQ